MLAPMTVRLLPLIKPYLLFSLILLPPPRSTLFPYTTLFRSAERALELPKHCGVVISCEPFPASALLSGARSEEDTSGLQSPDQMVCTSLPAATTSLDGPAWVAG